MVFRYSERNLWCLQDVDANQVIGRAYHRYGISLGGGLSKVAGRVFRIGHLGDLNEVMVMMALAGAEMAMRDTLVLRFSLAAVLAQLKSISAKL